MCSHRVRVAALVASALLITSGPPAAAAPSRTGAKASAGKATATGHVLPWIEDDLPRAVAEAKARKLPIFVESWAPW